MSLTQVEPIKPSATMTQSLVNQVFQRLFGDEGYHFDLIGGTIENQAGTRIIYISTDIIRGIYEALYTEAGDAWKVVLKSCGYLWGKRVATSLDKELQALINQRLDNLTVKEYIDLIEYYFAMHGWGKVAIHLEDAQAYGIVRATLTHSLFVNALNQLDDHVDAMIAGMLKGLFESISGQALDCIEVTCARRHAAPCCEFLISAPARITSITSLIDEEVTFDDILEQLRQT